MSDFESRRFLSTQGAHAEGPGAPRMARGGAASREAGLFNLFREERSQALCCLVTRFLWIVHGAAGLSLCVDLRCSRRAGSAGHKAPGPAGGLPTLGEGALLTLLPLQPLISLLPMQPHVSHGCSRNEDSKGWAGCTLSAL